MMVFFRTVCGWGRVGVVYDLAADQGVSNETRGEAERGTVEIELSLHRA